jgi:hypothetical protein
MRGLARREIVNEWIDGSLTHAELAQTMIEEGIASCSKVPKKIGLESASSALSRIARET